MFRKTYILSLHGISRVSIITHSGVTIDKDAARQNARREDGRGTAKPKENKKKTKTRKHGESKSTEGQRRQENHASEKATQGHLHSGSTYFFNFFCRFGLFKTVSKAS
jgi:hypothetical protein